MILCTINGGASFVYRVRDLSPSAPAAKVALSEFPELIKHAVEKGLASYSKPHRQRVATCACGKSYAYSKKRSRCFECEQTYVPPPKPPKPEPKLPNLPENHPTSRKFTCPYCFEKGKRTRANQATCKRRECQRKHWALLKQVYRY